MEGTELVKAEVVELGTLRASSAEEMVSEASGIAKSLTKVIEKNKLFTKIGHRKHVHVEGWTTLLALLGIVPREVSIEEKADGGYIAVVELVRMSDSTVVGRASAECGMDEPTWKSRPRYARRSMAATRATGKAARLGFSWIISLAGYDATPYEEMNVGGVTAAPAKAEPVAAPAGQTTLIHPADEVCVHYGKNAGTPVSELNDWKLGFYYLKAAENMLKPQHSDADKALHAACIAEHEKRQIDLPEPDDDKYQQ